MKRTNYVVIIVSIIIVISVFLPWYEASSSSSFGDFNSSFSSGGISGISFGGGILGLLLAFAGGFMALKNIKWAFITGVFNFFIGLGYMLGWFGSIGGVSYSSSYGGASAQASIDPQIGLYLFVIGSLIFAIFTLKNLKGSN